MIFLSRGWSLVIIAWLCASASAFVPSLKPTSNSRMPLKAENSLDPIAVGSVLSIAIATSVYTFQNPEFSDEIRAVFDKDGTGKKSSTSATRKSSPPSSATPLKVSVAKLSSTVEQVKEVASPTELTELVSAVADSVEQSPDINEVLKDYQDEAYNIAVSNEFPSNPPKKSFAKKLVKKAFMPWKKWRKL